VTINKFLFKKIFLPLLILLLIFLSPFYFFEILYFVLASLKFEVPTIKDIYEILPLPENGKKAFVGLVFSLIYLIFIRKINSNKLFNSGNIYYDISNIYFWIATNILGYKKISLKFVPVAFQFKILLNDLFEDISAENHPEINKQVNISEKNLNINSDVINFILSDTYEIKDDLIPGNISILPTIFIDNYINAQGQRIFNQNFINEIKKMVDKYSQEYSKVNIFATTNTMHNKEIINYCFKNAGRIGFKEIYVFKQSNRETFEFDNQGEKAL